MKYSLLSYLCGVLSYGVDWFNTNYKGYVGLYVVQQELSYRKQIAR